MQGRLAVLVPNIYLCACIEQNRSDLEPLVPAGGVQRRFAVRIERTEQLFGMLAPGKNRIRRIKIVIFYGLEKFLFW